MQVRGEHPKALGQYLGFGTGAQILAGHSIGRLRGTWRNVSRSERRSLVVKRRHAARGKPRPDCFSPQDPRHGPAGGSEHGFDLLSWRWPAGTLLSVLLRSKPARRI